MAQGIRRPHEAVDFAAIERLYPPPPEYYETAFYEDREIDRAQTAVPVDRKGVAHLLGPVPPGPLGQRRVSSESHQDHRRPVAGAVLHDRRHPQEHRQQHALRRLSGRHPRAGPPRAHAGLHVGRNHREVPAHLLHGLGPHGRRRVHRPSPVPARYPPGRRGAELVVLWDPQRGVVLR